MTEQYISRDGNTYTDENGDEVSTQEGVNAPKMHPVNRQWEHDIPKPSITELDTTVDVPVAVRPTARPVELPKRRSEINPAHYIPEAKRRLGIAAIAQIRRQQGWDVPADQTDSNN